MFLYLERWCVTVVICLMGNRVGLAAELTALDAKIRIFSG